MAMGIKVTLELVESGATSEMNPLKKLGQDYNSIEHLLRGKCVTIIPGVVMTGGSNTTRNLNLFKLIALLRAGTAMTAVTTEIDALSP
jgi:hypothetical protein